MPCKIEKSSEYKCLVSLNRSIDDKMYKKKNSVCSTVAIEFQLLYACGFKPNHEDKSLATDKRFRNLKKKYI